MGQQGDVTFVNGTGISLDGLTINNTGVISLEGTTGDVTLNRGSGISIRDNNHEYGFRVITGYIQEFYSRGDTITAGRNNDTVNFAAGCGISVIGDPGSKTITITSNSFRDIVRVNSEWGIVWDRQE